MAQIRFANNVSTQLTKPVAANDSTIEVRSLTHSLVWPNISATGDYFLIVIDDIESSTWEIMKCTKVQVNGDATVLTVERGLEGTTATTFNAGSVVENRLTAGTLDAFGAGFPAKVEINRGGTGATTAAGARTNLDVPSKADLSSEVSTRTSEVARLDQKIIDNIPPAATTSVRGTTTLSSAVDSVSEAVAATPKAVKTAYDKAVAVDTRLTSEVTTLEAADTATNQKLTSEVNTLKAADTATNQKLTSEVTTLKAADTATNQKLTSEVSRLEGEIAAHTPPDATTSTKGIVQLSSVVNSTSETLAATPKAVKTAYDKAVSAASAASAAAANSASANKLTTARSITLTGPVTGTVDFDGSTNVSLTTTVTSATTSLAGIVQLNNTVTSTSTTQAATASAVKTAYDKAVKAADAVSSIQAFEVGELRISFADSLEGCLLCDGSTVSRTTYSALFGVIGTTFGAGDGSTTFTLPNYVGRTIQGASTDAVGTVLNAGLPNFSGEFWAYTVGWSNASGTGPFYNIGAAGTPGNRGGEGGNACTWGFNPARVSSVYGNSTTVQPPAITANVFIKY